MALNELLQTFTNEAEDVATARTSLEGAKGAAAEAQAAVVAAQGVVSTETGEARDAFNALIAALNDYATELGIN
jgi:hypothetical protein